jgi:flagella basal body P-ring formation protein FlgA
LKQFALFNLALVLMLPALAAADDSAAPVIQVQERVELEMEHDITIGDIADFKGFDENDLGEIRSVRIGEAPSKTESRNFSNVSLSQVFRRYIPKLQQGRSEKIVLMIPTNVVVSRKTFKLEAKSIESELIKQWKLNCPSCEFNFIQPTVVPLVPTSISSDSVWAVRVRPELPRGSFSVPLEINGPEGRKQYWVSGTVSVYRNVPVAKRTIELGERIQPNDFMVQKRDVTFVTDGVPTEAELNGSVAARAIGAEQVIGHTMLRREQAVKMGESVKVVTGTDGWQISIEGVSQQSAYIGDSVRVKIPRTQKILSGILREKGTVEVQ